MRRRSSINCLDEEGGTKDRDHTMVGSSLDKQAKEAIGAVATVEMAGIKEGLDDNEEDDSDV